MAWFPGSPASAPDSSEQQQPPGFTGPGPGLGHGALQGSPDCAPEATRWRSVAGPPHSMASSVSQLRLQVVLLTKLFLLGGLYYRHSQCFFFCSIWLSPLLRKRQKSEPITTPQCPRHVCTRARQPQPILMRRSHTMSTQGLHRVLKKGGH